MSQSLSLVIGKLILVKSNSSTILYLADLHEHGFLLR